MNGKIVSLLRDKIRCSSIKYSDISRSTGIDYQRLMRIFNQNAVISGSELICLCKLLAIKQSELMSLIDEAA